MSIDQLAARRIGQNSLLPSLELCIEDGAQDCGVGLSCAYRNTISWQTATSPLPMENNPQVVFERLFGDGATEQQRAARRDQARSLLDSVMDEVGSLQRTLPAKDRERMDRYLTDIREVERRIALAATQGALSVKLPNAPAGIPEDFDAHVKLLFRPAGTRMAGKRHARDDPHVREGDPATPFTAASGVREPFHNLSHHSNVPESLARLAQLNTYHVKTLAYLLQKLRTTPDGESNLLDNSLILYGSGMSNSNQHDHAPLPVVLAGGAAGKLQGGRHIQVAAHTPLSNLQVAMLQKLGLGEKSFGDSTGSRRVVKTSSWRTLARWLLCWRLPSWKPPAWRPPSWCPIACTALLLSAPPLVYAVAETPRIADAAEQADDALVRSLLKQHVPVNEPGRDGTPALHWVVRPAKPRAREGFDPRRRRCQRVNSLWPAAATPRHPERRCADD